MKKTILYITALLVMGTVWMGCKRDSDYIPVTVSPYISLYDLRELYEGSDINLTKENMYGCEKITGVVISDYAQGNLPPGYLLVQDKRRLSQLRGIAIPIGAAATNYLSGDSVIVTVTGGILTRADNLLQIKNISTSAITKIASGKSIAPNRVNSSAILANPLNYESTLVAIVKGGFDPIPKPTDKYAGDRVVNDGFDNITLHTEPNAVFANSTLPVSANFYGIVFNTTAADGKLVPQIRMRKADDAQILSSSISLTPIVISGFINDVSGTDGNYEYIQLLATRDIDFAATPFSVVVCNNAGASTPGNFPTNGWATGGGSVTPATTFRTFKFNLTSGTAKKGTFFYVGGSGKMINGSGSTSMTSSNWIRSFNYTTTDGDGFGIRNGGFFANSGNAFGMAVFNGTAVTKDSEPIDVMFVSTGGNLFLAGPPAQGYKITNTDFYDVVNPVTLQSQPYYRQGANTLCLTYTTPADQGFFYKLGGIYNARLGRWVKARTQSIVQLTKTSAINEIEGEFPAASGTSPAVAPTSIKD
jgi:hypothetical protein